MTRDKGMMTFQTFKKIIDDIKHFGPRVALHHSGESFLHKDLFGFIHYAKEADLTVGLTTNGTMLEKEDFEILNTGIDTLNVSLAGIEEADYRRIRSKENFNTIKKNILY